MGMARVTRLATINLALFLFALTEMFADLYLDA